MKRQFVQCCHGGFELEFAHVIRAFLDDDSRTSQNISKACRVGLNWSDFNGFPSSSESERNIGTNVGVNDTIAYLKETGVGALFRGHQDTISSFKLIRPRNKYPVPWYKQVSNWPNSIVSDDKIGLHLIDAAEPTNQTIPVFTLSTAKHIRLLSEDGFCILHMNGPTAHSWILVAHFISSHFVYKKYNPYRGPSGRNHVINKVMKMGSLSEWCALYAQVMLLRKDELLKAVGILVEKIPPRVNKTGYIQKVFVAPGTRVAMCGDIHGCQDSLVRVLKAWIKMGILNDKWEIHPNALIVFLGDLVDRGSHSTEVCLTVLRLHSKNPTRCYVVRGNHEVPQDAVYSSVSSSTSFYNELTRRFPHAKTPLLKQFTTYFHKLPDALFIGLH